MRYTKDEDKAMQILNDGFLKVFLKLHTFRNEGSLEGWIRRLVYRTMADFYKKENTYIKFIDLNAPEDKPIPVQPSTQLEWDDLMSLLDHLPGRSADVFRMHAIEGYSHEEISQQMHISIGTSKWHLSHARERLRNLLNQRNNVRTTSL